MRTSNQRHKHPVLVVEDEDLVRLCAHDMLEEEGFEVIEANSADAAMLIMAQREDVRVLFTDIQMPGTFDGLELAYRVHAQWPHVLLLITSGGRVPLGAEIADHGRFLRKPYRGLDVVQAIRVLEEEAAERNRG